MPAPSAAVASKPGPERHLGEPLHRAGRAEVAGELQIAPTATSARSSWSTAAAAIAANLAQRAAQAPGG